MTANTKLFFIIMIAIIIAGMIAGCGQQEQLSQQLSIETIPEKEEIFTEKPSGWFTTGQNADIVLSAIDFNNAGGSLLFNHPGGIASDGIHLILADRNNNRILIWNSLPTSNTEPDVVLGQENFITNNPGDELDELNWPVSVATDGKHLLVADTENDRVLVWNSLPTENSQPADFVLLKEEKSWPWAVWTNGEKVVVTVTWDKKIYIWNTFPTEANQEPDLIITNDDFGTPRSIGSNGENLLIGDHNAFDSNQGTFFWTSFPASDDEPYDFFVEEPDRMGMEEQSSMSRGSILWGAGFSDDGSFVAFGRKLYVWDHFPTDEDDAPSLSIGMSGPVQKGYLFKGGDGGNLVVLGKNIYITENNGNKIVGYYSIPTNSSAEPDFVIGAPDIETNTLKTNYFITNSVPATNGESLFVSSDFDKKVYVWKKMPDESGTYPDFVFEEVAGWDNELYKDIFVLAGGKFVYIWDPLPLEKTQTPKTFSGSIGAVDFQDIKGIALDDNYFYISDYLANKVYVWDGIPEAGEDPLFSLSIDQPWRLSSDGEYLAVTVIFSHQVYLYEVDKLSQYAEPVAKIGGVFGSSSSFWFNLPEYAIVSNGHLFVADTGFHRVLAWEDTEDAIAGKVADVILGEKNLTDVTPEIGQDKLFWPAGMAFDGSYLWVGEYKFSGRLLRFSVQENSKK